MRVQAHRLLRADPTTQHLGIGRDFLASASLLRYTISFYEGITFYLLVLTQAAGHGVWASVDSCHV